MGTLHGRLNGLSADPIQAAKGVRAVLSSLRMPDTGMARASALVEVAQTRGLVLVAAHNDTERLVRAQGEGQHASNGHMAFYVNLDPETARLYLKPESADPDRDGRTPATRLRPVPEPPPEPNAAATMAVMMAMNNGNPLVAAAHCRNLARTTTADVFKDAEALLVEGFPWIKAKLDAGEIA